ncbi:MAG TPA: phosphoglycolate phosphatase [Aestuariivirgaceae bacterium]|jgi:phosphoglycolate phosphatase|nr:phosphoglycolate phosphatase [Aestuariivirgaceae bacterium]
MAPFAAIFDLDGTLIDTAPDLTRATNHVLSSQGRRAISVAELRPFVGRGARRMIERGFAATGTPAPPDLVDSLYDAFIAYYTENIAVDSRPFPGTLELLDRLEEAGVKLGICTNKQERLSLRLMDGLGLTQRFGAIVGADTIGISKPDPAPYREAVARLGATGGGSVMIGDSETDILTARAAGVPVIAVTFGYTDRHVAEFNPDHAVDHMDHVWPAIAGYLLSAG